MGNCCDRCFGRFGRRKYLRTRYNVERDFSIEFENLMEDENQQEDIMKGARLQIGGPFTVSSYMRWLEIVVILCFSVVTPRERLLLAQRQYGTLIEEQQEQDQEKDQKLVQQEEELRREEEAYYEAKRAAAHAAKVQRQWEQTTAASKNNTLMLKNGAKNPDEEDWDIAGTEDDFETFLENVKARSLAARTRALPSQVPVDQQSSSSLTSKDRTDDCASSLDLEWEHEAGMQPPPKRDKKKRVHHHTREEISVLAELAVKPMLHMKDKQATEMFSSSPPNHNDFEWDSDVAEPDSSEHDSESRTLLSNSTDTVER